MNSINKIEAVTERDIDLLLLEEFNVSGDFSGWFLSRIAEDRGEEKCTGAWHSVTDAALGESDLVVLYQTSSRVLAVLIENKIDALAQPAQGERYHERGRQGIASGKWDEFMTCMVAPERYLKGEQDSRVYDVAVSYEEIAGYFAAKGADDLRAAYKGYLLDEAIEQNRRGYTITPDERVSDFWLQYWRIATEKYPELEMKEPGPKPANSDWPTFNPVRLPRNLSIVHKLDRGVVDLQITGAAERIDELNSRMPDYEWVVAGKSAAIRLKVVPVDRSTSFESQQDCVEEGMRAASSLLSVGTRLDDVL